MAEIVCIETKSEAVKKPVACQQEDETMRQLDRLLSSKSERAFEEAFEELWRSLRRDYWIDWNSAVLDGSCETCEPNNKSEVATKKVLKQLNGIRPSTIVPSASGGVGIIFTSGQKYADIQCLNSGSVVGIKSNRCGKIETFKLKNLGQEEVKNAISRIADFFNP